MFYFLIALQALLCLMMIGLVLLQQGKGADMGAAFGGGSSSSIFGAAGAGNMITKITTGVCVAFMVSSLFLIKTYQNHGGSGIASDPLAGSVMEGAAAPSSEAAAPAVEDENAEQKAPETGAAAVAPPVAPPPAKPQAPADSAANPAEAPAQAPAPQP